MSRLTLSQACDGLILFKTASGLSHFSIRNYRVAFKKLLRFFPDDPPIAEVTNQQLQAFFVWLQEDYVSNPDGAAPRGPIRLSPKTVRNIHAELSSLWSWAKGEGYVKENVVRSIKPPPADPPVIEPLTQEQCQALLKACGHTRSWATDPSVRNRRPTALRDQLIILLLLDTGVRSSELCGITVGAIDLAANSIKVAGKGKGRGKKERIVHFGKRTAKVLWRYLTPRLEETNDNSPLLTVGTEGEERPMDRNILGRLVKRIGERAGVKGVHPHRFRHTFAINYLRNGGDIFTLQALLGHSSLDMVRHYLNIVSADCADAHRRASPVDTWRL